jgi:hypothetical protein
MTTTSIVIFVGYQGLKDMAKVKRVSGNAKEYIRELKHKITKDKVRVGFLERKTYPGGATVPMVAAIHEYGGGRVPPRPFFRPMIKDKKDEWKDLSARLMKAHMNTETVLGILGEHISGELRQSILSVPGPPLARSTVKKKGFDKLLVNTGLMLESIDWEIHKK